MPSVRVFEPLPGIWCVHYRAKKSSAYIVKTDPGALIVDAGPEPSASALMMGLQAARVGLSSVRALVLTGTLPHQVSGAATFQKRSGTTLCFSQTATAGLEGRRLRGGDVIENRLEAVESAHASPGELAYCLHTNRVLFHGDLNASELLERLDCEPEWLLPARGTPCRAAELRGRRR